ncbi:MAG TPA: response regulator transcription factor [Ferruginibacter sp.]|nr:response regulator transcription factor [Ferruginibacter sp.]
MKSLFNMPANYTPINIILADDHEIFRDGFRVMLNKIPSINLIAEASNGIELIKLSRELKPDVIITDIKMPEMDGISATRQLTNEFPAIGVIALSMFDEENLIVDMLEAGAKGYLLKNSHKEEIVSAVKAVYADETYYCRNTSLRLAQMIAKSSYNPYKRKVKPEFTSKEVTIIQLICQELSNKEIGDKLNLSRRTVEGYREKILEKMQAKNTAGIVVYALRNKIYQ